MALRTFLSVSKSSFFTTNIGGTELIYKLSSPAHKAVGPRPSLSSGEYVIWVFHEMVSKVWDVSHKNKKIKNWYLEIINTTSIFFCENREIKFNTQSQSEKPFALDSRCKLFNYSHWYLIMSAPGTDNSSYVFLFYSLHHNKRIDATN